METLARASGATLGYIAGNLPGAYYGYKLAGMAPISRKRKAFSRPFNNKRRKMGGSFKKRRSSETGITTQFDRTTQYSKKSMPRYKKRRWRKFVNKVTAVLDKSLGTRTVLFNNTIAAQENAGFQGIAACCLYGHEGVTDTPVVAGFRDVYRICNNDNDVMVKNTQVNPSKIVFRSGVIDMTMRNSGSSAVEVDVYEINVLTDNTETGSAVSTLAQASIDTGNIPGAAQGLGLQFRGTTLFDLPNAIAMDKWKIYKKRKYFLPVGSTATLQHRDPRNHYYNAANIQVLENNVGSYGNRKMTTLFVFVAKEIVGQDAVGVNLNVGVSRKYAYCVNQSSKALDSYNPV